MLLTYCPKIETVLARLRYARRRCHWSQADAALTLGIHRPTLSMIENGKQQLTVEMLFKMCDAYDKYPSDILRPGDDPWTVQDRERRVIGEE